MRCLKTLTALLLLGMNQPVLANPSLAVLDFELNDITSLPDTPQELLRTASIRPLLEQALAGTGNYKLIHIDSGSYTQANPGPGYLFSHHDLAARLGQHYGVDYMIVGQHSKPSFLFSYLIADLIEVKSGKLISRFDIELKGNHGSVTQHGISKLTHKIMTAISQTEPATQR